MKREASVFVYNECEKVEVFKKVQPGVLLFAAKSVRSGESVRRGNRKSR
jgi:hypothetical protein